MKVRTIICICFLLCAVGLTDATAGEPAWDLTYQTLLESRTPTSIEWLSAWLEMSDAPSVSKLLRRKRKSTDSAILIEYPAFHAGERLTFLILRTEQRARCWSFVEASPGEHKGTAVDVSAFDQLLHELMSWKKLPSPASNEVPDDAPPGYFAILSVYDGSGSKQVLLTLRDFMLPIDADWRDTEPGRIYRAFAPVVELYD